MGAGTRQGGGTEGEPPARLEGPGGAQGPVSRVESCPFHPPLPLSWGPLASESCLGMQWVGWRSTTQSPLALPPLPAERRQGTAGGGQERLRAEHH